MDTPWAVLKCKFKDNNVEPFNDDFYHRLFTREGIGSQNMVDYFDDCSHSEIDLSDSEVFGWFTIDRLRSDYDRAFNENGHEARWELIDWARSAAVAAGVNFERFYGTVICFNVPTDLFGALGGRVAVCDNWSMNVSALAQEMGHGYGLDHSRMDGSLDDYQDPWDVMSTFRAFMSEHPEWKSIGPGLNAWNMRGRSWLEDTRVWRGRSRYGYSVEIDLRPLHRRDLPGLLVAEVGEEFLVEFRMNEGWDAGFTQPVVLVHRFEGNHSYLMRSNRGFFDLREGDVFELGFSDNFFAPYTRVDVININASDRIAHLRISYRPAREPELDRSRFGGKIIGGVRVGGRGAIIVGGRIIPIPPNDPTLRILEQLAEFKAGEMSLQPQIGKLMQQEALKIIAKQIEQMQLDADLLSVPAPHTELDERGFPKNQKGINHGKDKHRQSSNIMDSDKPEEH